MPIEDVATELKLLASITVSESIITSFPRFRIPSLVPLPIVVDDSYRVFVEALLPVKVIIEPALIKPEDKLSSKLISEVLDVVLVTVIFVPRLVIP